VTGWATLGNQHIKSPNFVPPDTMGSALFGTKSNWNSQSSNPNGDIYRIKGVNPTPLKP